MRGWTDRDGSDLAQLALAFVGLVWMTHGLDFVLYEAFPKIVVRVFALALFTASAAALYGSRSNGRVAFLRTWPVWIAPLLALLSLLWSDAPDLTLRRSSALLGSTCFGVFLASRFRIDEQIALVAACMTVIAALSVVVILFAPEIGLYDKEGLWQGVFSHKNYLGRAMALGALAYLLLALANRSLLAAAGVVACTFLVLRSGSASGIISAAVPLAASAALRGVQTIPKSVRLKALAICGLLALVGTGLAIVFADEVLAIVGKDATLTGRLYIWNASIQEIRVQPWLGYGFGAVWYTERPGVAQVITHSLGFDPYTAHSGFFDLLLELGIAGLLALAIPATVCAFRGVQWIVANDSPICLWPGVYLVFFVVANVAESELVRQNSIFWVLLVATVVSTSPSNRQNRRERTGHANR